MKLELNARIRKVEAAEEAVDHAWGTKTDRTATLVLELSERVNWSKIAAGCEYVITIEAKP